MAHQGTSKTLVYVPKGKVFKWDLNMLVYEIVVFIQYHGYISKCSTVTWPSWLYQSVYLKCGSSVCHLSEILVISLHTCGGKFCSLTAVLVTLIAVTSMTVWMWWCILGDPYEDFWGTLSNTDWTVTYCIVEHFHVLCLQMLLVHHHNSNRSLSWKCVVMQWCVSVPRWAGSI